MKPLEQIIEAISNLEPGNREGVITLILIITGILLFALGITIGKYFLP